MSFCGFLRKHRTLCLFLIPPVLLLPLVILGNSQKSKCAYGLALMAFYWVTETFPVAITAMLPIVLFPVMGVSKIETISGKYFNPTIFNLIGALTVAIAIERWNVHKRFALRLLLIFGTTPMWLMLGFMLATFSLSMWLLNIPTTAMMVPIAQAVLTQLLSNKTTRDQNNTVHEILETKTIALLKSHQYQKEQFGHYFTKFYGIQFLRGIRKKFGNYKDTTCRANGGDAVISDVSSVELNLDKTTENDVGSCALNITTKTTEEFDFDALDEESQSICKATMLAICYAANCGGIATLTGTGTNLVMKGHADLISDGESGITFATWFVFSFPVALINVLLAWLCLQVFFFGIRSLFRSRNTGNSERVKRYIKQQYHQLGNLSFPEKAVLLHLVALVLAWFTINPEFFQGWGFLFRVGYLSGAVPAMFIAILLFVIPSGIEKNDVSNPSRANLLDWKTFNKKFPWEVTLLIGGGFALAHACKESGLSLWLAHQMTALIGVPTWILVFIVCLICSLCTEVAGNIAICSIFMPILADLGKGVGINPIFFMLPAAISTSFAFMLPVSTPPNTIAFSYGYFRIIDMVKVGWFLNVLCVIVVSVAVNTWGMIYFRFDVLPEWATLSDMTFLNSTSSTYTSILNFTQAATIK
ncbi:solute carrier family 13 member 2-like [Ylistrum balloti]|uniref:solute carrier family 13 member 2-like n=1 Tax=Ylistrum balloti TaxID=509963 RepID=UPI002905952D|nr:solute carrier family 13 member 2-like [Ylistrum balloti]